MSRWTKFRNTVTGTVGGLATTALGTAAGVIGGGLGLLGGGLGGMAGMSGPLPQMGQAQTQGTEGFGYQQNLEGLMNMVGQPPVNQSITGGGLI